MNNIIVLTMKGDSKLGLLDIKKHVHFFNKSSFKLPCLCDRARKNTKFCYSYATFLALEHKVLDCKM